MLGTSEPPLTVARVVTQPMRDDRRSALSDAYAQVSSLAGLPSRPMPSTGGVRHPGRGLPSVWPVSIRDTARGGRGWPSSPGGSLTASRPWRSPPFRGGDGEGRGAWEWCLHVIHVVDSEPTVLLALVGGFDCPTHSGRRRGGPPRAAGVELKSSMREGSRQPRQGRGSACGLTRRGQWRARPATGGDGTRPPCPADVRLGSRGEKKPERKMKKKYKILVGPTFKSEDWRTLGMRGF